MDKQPCKLRTGALTTVYPSGGTLDGPSVEVVNRTCVSGDRAASITRRYSAHPAFRPCGCSPEAALRRWLTFNLPYAQRVSREDIAAVFCGAIWNLREATSSARPMFSTGVRSEAIKPAGSQLTRLRAPSRFRHSAGSLPRLGSNKVRLIKADQGSFAPMGKGLRQDAHLAPSQVDFGPLILDCCKFTTYFSRTLREMMA